MALAFSHDAWYGKNMKFVLARLSSKFRCAIHRLYRCPAFRQRFITLITKRRKAIRSADTEGGQKW